MTEKLEFQSVLGPLDPAMRNSINPLNCDGYLTPNADSSIPVNANFGTIGNWDNFRTQYDQSGFISRFSERMPLPNNYQRGDGLNTAAYRWTRRGNGGATIFGGSLYDDNRKAITVKLDHNINAEHRISGTYSYETNYGDDAERTWPEVSGGYGGLIERKPITFTMGLISTLRPTLLNEYRMGMHRTDTMTYEPLGNPQTRDKMSAVLRDLINTTDSSRFPRYNGFELVAGPGGNGNLIYTNPQFAAVYIKRNADHANYHSMQTQFTMRPAYGLNFQATYTWSRNLARSVGASITDYRDWTGDYNLAQMHRGHQLNLNGSYTLPFGPRGMALRNATGAVKKTVEDWSLGWIFSAISGAPFGLSGINTLWANGTLNQVGPFDRKQGKVEWDYDAEWGLYYGKGKYDRVIDPICMDVDVVAASLRSNCINGLRALVEVDNSKEIAGYKNWSDANGSTDPVRGTIIFQNAKPGERGNFKPNSLYAPGRWTLDANLSKSIEFMEGKRIEVRIDAQNVLNHATPTGAGSGMFDSGGSSIGSRNTTVSNPAVTVNTTGTIPFGHMFSKAGHRTFQGRVRLSF